MFSCGSVVATCTYCRLFVRLPALGQSLGDRALACDDGADTLGHVGAQGSELGDADELDAVGRPRLDTGVLRIGVLDGEAFRLEERRGLLELGVLVGGDALAGRHLGPAEPGGDQFLILPRTGPGDELPGRILLLGRRLHGPGPGPQPARGLGVLHRGLGIADLALHGGRIGFQSAGCGGGVVPHGDLALAHVVQAFGEPGLGRPRFTVLAHQLGVKLDRCGEFRRVDLCVPVLVEPGSAEGVDHRGQRREDLAPAGLAAQADALHARRCAVCPGGQGRDFIPGGLLRHRQALGIEDVFPVHQEGGFAVKRFAVELPVLARQRRRIRRQDVRLVEFGIRGHMVQRCQPAVGGIERDLIVGQRRDVVLAGLARELLADLGPDIILGQDRVVDLDAGFLGEVIRSEPLQILHLGVVHHQDIDAVRVSCRIASAGTCTGRGTEGHAQGTCRQ